MADLFGHHHDDPAVALIAQSLASIAHSFALLVQHELRTITPEEKAAIDKITSDLKSSHDRLVAAIQQAQVPK